MAVILIILKVGLKHMKNVRMAVVIGVQIVIVKILEMGCHNIFSANHRLSFSNDSERKNTIVLMFLVYQSQDLNSLFLIVFR